MPPHPTPRDRSGYSGGVLVDLRRPPLDRGTPPRAVLGVVAFWLSSLVGLGALPLGLLVVGAGLRTLGLAPGLAAMLAGHGDRLPLEPGWLLALGLGTLLLLLGVSLLVYWRLLASADGAFGRPAAAALAEARFRRLLAAHGRTLDALCIPGESPVAALEVDRPHVQHSRHLLALGLGAFLHLQVLLALAVLPLAWLGSPWMDLYARVSVLVAPAVWLLARLGPLERRTTWLLALLGLAPASLWLVVDPGTWLLVGRPEGLLAVVLWGAGFAYALREPGPRRFLLLSSMLLRLCELDSRGLREIGGPTRPGRIVRRSGPGGAIWILHCEGGWTWPVRLEPAAGEAFLEACRAAGFPLEVEGVPAGPLGVFGELDHYGGRSVIPAALAAACLAAAFPLLDLGLLLATTVRPAVGGDLPAQAGASRLEVACRRVLRRYPGDTASRLHLADALLTQGKIAEAEAALGRVRQLDRQLLLQRLWRRSPARLLLTDLETRVPCAAAVMGRALEGWEPPGATLAAFRQATAQLVGVSFSRLLGGRGREAEELLRAAEAAPAAAGPPGMLAWAFFASPAGGDQVCRALGGSAPGDADELGGMLAAVTEGRRRLLERLRPLATDPVWGRLPAWVEGAWPEWLLETLVAEGERRVAQGEGLEVWQGLARPYAGGRFVPGIRLPAVGDCGDLEALDPHQRLATAPPRSLAELLQLWPELRVPGVVPRRLEELLRLPSLSPASPDAVHPSHGS